MGEGISYEGQLTPHFRILHIQLLKDGETGKEDKNLKRISIFGEKFFIKLIIPSLSKSQQLPLLASGQRSSPLCKL